MHDALLSLSSWCLVIALWLFLAVPRVSLQFVSVVYPYNTHYFMEIINCYPSIYSMDHPEFIVC